MPMVVSCVQHYSTHFIKKLGKSLEPFFHNVQKTAKRAKKDNKAPQRAVLAKSAIRIKKRPRYVRAPEVA